MSISVNGEIIAPEAVALAAAEFAATPDPHAAAARALTVQALLRQRMCELGIDGDDEDAAVEALLAREVTTPEPTQQECRRFFEANRSRFRSGDLFEASHILFAVTDGAPVEAIRRKAEEVLLALTAAPAGFTEAARQYSNCPSGQLGGNLGQLDEQNCVPEFFAALRESPGTGVLPRLVRSRYGFHIAHVERRIEGRELPFELVRESIAQHLLNHVRGNAWRQYVQVLAGRAQITGVDLGASGSPLLQ